MEPAASLHALRDAVTCVAGYGALIADAAQAGEPPDPAWIAALHRGADDILARWDDCAPPETGRPGRA